MKIANAGPVNPPILRKRHQPGPAKSGFSEAMQDKAETAAVSGPADVAAISSLLALQEVDDPVDGQQRGIRRGQDMLEELDELRHGLLSGAYSRDKLSRLLSLTRAQQENVSDPALRDIIGEIELRAAVELAKLGTTG